MTSFAGVFYAFFYNNLFPEQVFHILRSIELILGPIIGGLGTLFGPILGAFVLTGLAEILSAMLNAMGVDVPGAKQVFYGVACCSWWWRCRRVSGHGWRGGFRLVGAQAMSTASVGRAASASASAAWSQSTASASKCRRARSIAVIGPNGAGKTTLFNLIAGEFAPDGGDDHICRASGSTGYAPDEVCRRGIGRTFQLVRPFPALSVEDNVTIGALLHRRQVSAARAHAHDVLRRLDLFDKRALPASALTLPDRKRLEVARALATDPKLLLLDEVMAGLRPTETDRIVAVLRELNRETGLTILLIEHVMRAVMALAQRMLVLHHGAAIAEGAPEAVVRERAVIKSYLGAEAIA